MQPIDVRAREHHLSAFVAHDTIALIADRVERLVRSGRRMTKVGQYVGDSALTVRAGLVLDLDSPGSGFRVSRQDRPAGVLVDVLLSRVERFGLSAYDHHGDEKSLRDRYRSGDRRSVALVTVDGFGEGVDDRIEIEWWNEHGVGQRTVVAFDRVEAREVVESQAVLLDALAAESARTGLPWTAGQLAGSAESMRARWETLPEHLGHLSRI